MKFELVRKEQYSRRRLSLLMDSYVDSIISDDYFYAILYVGSPYGQRVEMALDTGSGLPYFACKSTCKHCGNHDDKPYNILNSTSFQWISCKHNLCGAAKCNNNGHCEWTQKYVDKSSISAAVGSDLISFYKYPHIPSMQSKLLSVSVSFEHEIENLKKLRLVFGCSQNEANTIYRQGADGVMGLSIHHRSFVDQLFNHKNGVNLDLGKKQFAHCFGVQTGGLLLFGSNEIDELIQKFNISHKWTPLITSNGGHGWYRVKTVGFRVESNGNDDSNGNNDGVQPIDIKYTSNLNSGYRGSVIDTGSSTLSMPLKSATAIKESILKIVHAKLAKNGFSDKFSWTKDVTKNYDFFLQWNNKKNFNKNDWNKFANEYIKYFPDIIMIWDNNLNFRISVNQYLLFKLPHFCLDLFGDTPSILVGSNVMINKFIIYDRENMKLGVADINCDKLIYATNTNANNISVTTSSLNTPSTTKKTTTSTTTVNDNINAAPEPEPEPEPKSMNSAPTKPPKKKDDGDDDGEPVITIKTTNYNEMFMIYGIALVVAVIIILFICVKCKNKSSGNGSRTNIKYQALNTNDPEDVNNDKHRQPNHRRKKMVKHTNPNTSSSYIVSQSVADRINHIDLDILSTTTPTQSFTSTQHLSQKRQQTQTHHDAI